VSEDRSVLTRIARPPDQVLRYGPDPEHLVDVRLPVTTCTPRPLAMIVHGGFWRPAYDRTHTGPMGEALAAAGWSVASIEYRRIPGAPDATVDDVRLAIDTVPALVTRHTGKLLLIGHSAGGHLVLWAASCSGSPALHGVLALGAVADLQLAHARGLGEHAVLAFLGTDPAARPDLDPARLAPPRVSTTLLHGERDDIVPPVLAESYHAQHASRLVRVADAGHFAVIDPLSPAWATVLASLAALADGVAA
jgi:acetyl esterase/lipase